MNIAFDLDEVLCKTVTAALEHVMTKVDIDLSLDSITIYTIGSNKWSNDARLNKRIDDCIKWAFYEETVLFKAAPYQGAVELLSWLKHQGHNIYIITARGSSLLKTSVKWLERHEFCFDDVICTGFGNKAGYAKCLNLSYFVDDYHENLYDIYYENVCPHSGILLVNRPWNINECLKHEFVRVDDCEAIKCYVNNNKIWRG